MGIVICPLDGSLVVSFTFIGYDFIFVCICVSVCLYWLGFVVLVVAGYFIKFVYAHCLCDRRLGLFFRFLFRWSAKSGSLYWLDL